jgi:hypothetical protein
VKSVWELTAENDTDIFFSTLRRPASKQSNYERSLPLGITAENAAAMGMACRTPN